MRKLTATATSLAIAAVASASLTATPAQAGGLGTTSVAEVLAADGLEFDETWKDFDILDQAVNDVIGEKPRSDVAVLADGSVKLTAFAPTDRAFRRLVEDLTGDKPADEAATYEALSTVGVDTIESILLYHVVPGDPIMAADAAESDGAKLETALGATVTVSVTKSGDVKLRDADRDDKNPRVLMDLKDLNEGNEQIAHGINRVLRPINL